MDAPSWAALLGYFPSTGDSGIQASSVVGGHCLQHIGSKDTVGRKMIMARAQLLIIHLSLEMTHITSVHIPSARIAAWSPLHARRWGNGVPGLAGASQQQLRLYKGSMDRSSLLVVFFIFPIFLLIFISASFFHALIYLLNKVY